MGYSVGRGSGLLCQSVMGELERGGKSHTAALERWSFTGATVRCPGPISLELGDPVKFTVRNLDYGTLSSPIRGIITHVSDERLEIAFNEITESEARSSLRVLRASAPPSDGMPAEVREIIEEPARIRTLFRSWVSNGRTGIVRRGDGEAVKLLGDAGCKGGEECLRFRIVEGKLPRPPYFLEVAGYSSVYWVPILGEISGAADNLDEGTVALQTPTVVIRVRRRRNPRAAATARHTVRFSHPVFGREIERPVRDISRSGLSFRTQPSEDLIHEGLSLEATVYGGEAPVALRAEVRSLTRIDECHHACGLSVHPASDDDRLAWNRLVGTILHPNTEMAADFGEALWSLYEESGYFELSGTTPERFSALKIPFIEAVKKLADASHIGGHVLWKSRGRIHASAAILRPYTGSWLGFQMAKLPGATIDGVPRRHILRDLLIHAFEHVNHDSSHQWFAAHYQVDATIGRLTQHLFAQRHEGSGEACILRFRAVQVLVGADFGAEDLETQGFEVGMATREEILSLVEGIGEQRPQAYVEALDFVEDRFDLAEVKRAWSQVGLGRERVVLAARRRGVMRAAAVLEAAEPGLHLYDLLDVVRIFVLGPRGNDATAALLEAAARWYGEHARERFIWLAEDRQSDLPVSGAFSDLGLADMTLVSQRLLPDLLAHIDEVMAPQSV